MQDNPIMERSSLSSTVSRIGNLEAGIQVELMQKVRLSGWEKTRFPVCFGTLADNYPLFIAENAFNMEDFAKCLRALATLALLTKGVRGGNGIYLMS
jgi:hypothetical protein